MMQRIQTIRIIPGHTALVDQDFPVCPVLKKIIAMFEDLGHISFVFSFKVHVIFLFPHRHIFSISL